jgi:hypothetical protein
MIIHNPILTGSFTVNGTDVSSITSSAASLTSLNAATASLNSFSASMLTFTASAATTGSNTFVGNQVVTGSLTVTGSITTPGTLTAQTLVVQTITSSVDFVTGSTRFGSLLENTHQFTGSVSVSGSGAFIGIVGVGGATEAGWSLKSNGNLKVENSNGTTVLQVNDTSTGGKAWSLISAGAGNAHSVAAGTFYLRNSSDSSTAFTIASTGAATFSSTISAGVITGDSNSTGTPSIVAKVGSGGNNGTFGFGNNSNYRIRGGSDYGAMIFDTAGAEQMRITGGGTPTFQIGTYAGNSDIQLTASTTGYSSVLFGDGASGINSYRGYIQYQHNGDYFIFSTDSTERMRIGSAGFIASINRPASDADSATFLNTLAASSTLFGLPTTSFIINYWKGSNSVNYKLVTQGSTYFTGQHGNKPINLDLKTNIQNYIGLIVSSTGAYYSVNPITQEVTTGKDAIQISEALPEIKLTDTDQDKAVWGVVTNVKNDNYNTDGTIETDNSTEWGDRLGSNVVRINGLGEGAIWVTNINGNIENGDYICSSTIPGYGRKQNDDLLHNYTVAKSTMDCEFDLNNDDLYVCEEFEFEGQIYKKAFIGCTYHCS